LALERFQGARKLTLKGMQANEWENTLDQAQRVGCNLYQIGQAFVASCGIVQHANGQVAKVGVLGEHGQKRLDDPWPQSLADDDPVHVAGVEIACRGLEAQRTDEA